MLWIFPATWYIVKQTEQQENLYKNLIPGIETPAAIVPSAIAAAVYALSPPCKIMRSPCIMYIWSSFYIPSAKRFIFFLHRGRSSRCHISKFGFLLRFLWNYANMAPSHPMVTLAPLVAITLFVWLVTKTWNLPVKTFIFPLTVPALYQPRAGCAPKPHHKTSAEETMQLQKPSGTIT